MQEKKNVIFFDNDEYKHEFMDLVHHKLLSIAINNPDHLFS